MSEQDSLVKVENLLVRFPVNDGKRKVYINPVDYVSFHINAGEVLALVGESGSGKSTIGKALLRIIEPASGTIEVGGQDVTHIKRGALKEYRKNVQMVFQDPFGSLNPTRTVEKHVIYPLKKHQTERIDIDQRVDELMQQVGLTPVDETRIKYPHELSGGQRQRVAIARALAANPKFLVADEPISMLDVSIRAGILKLMNQLREDYNLAYLYITHDLASARYFGHRIMVLYGGKIMETASGEELIRHPSHPYTKLLLAATPGSGIRGPLPETSNRAPNLVEGRKGCPFADRCPIVTDICREEAPPVVEVSTGHSAACHHVA